MKKLMKLRRKGGFTLVEIIVVIAIIGVLAAILIPTLIGYSIKSHISSVNRTASDMQKSINYFLTEANANRYGMFIAASSSTTGIITITNSQWNLTIADPSVFVSNAAVTWSGSGTGAFSTPPPNPSNAEDLLCAKLSDEFREIERGYIGFVLHAGVCRAVYVTTDVDFPIHILPFDPNGEGWSAPIYLWDGQNAGINDEGYYVGTSPVVDLG